MIANIDEKRYLRNTIEIIIKDNILTRSMLIRQFIKGRIINNISFMIHDGGLVQLSIRPLINTPDKYRYWKSAAAVVANGTCVVLLRQSHDRSSLVD